MQQTNVWKVFTVDIRANREAPCLTSSDGLGNGEKGGSQCANSFLEQNGASIERRASRGYLDTDPTLRDSDFLELVNVRAGVVKDLFLIICVTRRCLQQRSTLDVAYIFGAQEGALRGVFF